MVSRLQNISGCFANGHSAIGVSGKYDVHSSNQRVTGISPNHNILLSENTPNAKCPQRKYQHIMLDNYLQKLLNPLKSMDSGHPKRAQGRGQEGKKEVSNGLGGALLRPFLPLSACSCPVSGQ